MKHFSAVSVALLAYLAIGCAFANSASLENRIPTPGAATCSDSTGEPEAQVRHATIGRGDHQAALDLVPVCQATNRAVNSGAWTDPQIWQGGLIPEQNARVLIPTGISVEIDSKIASRLDWVRVDGQLIFGSDRDTYLAARTVVVTERGALRIGSEANPVLADVRARIIFLPRVSRNRQQDPYDMAGGLISQGVVQIYGARKTAHANPRSRLNAGLDRIAFAESPVGWRPGDRVLIPATELNAQDELRTIVAVEADTVQLDRPLEATHEAPAGVAVPIGNLTRNVEFRSEMEAPLEARGHVMIMHAQSGTIIDGASFSHLGRTDTRHAQTVPILKSDGTLLEGTDNNTIGRYALHFHVVSGARSSIEPHVVRNSVVEDSPKYGVVNHGGHVVVEDCVTFNVQGAHFVSENGSEIGAFRRNMAVRSSGSAEEPQHRMSLSDFGHGGHGYWLQSGAVELSDNWASGHAAAGIFIMGMPFHEGAKEIFFDPRNVGNPVYLRQTRNGKVRPADLNFSQFRNTVAGSGRGFDVWYHKFTGTAGLSLVDGLTVWNVVGPAVMLAYSRHVEFRHARLFGLKGPGHDGITVNGMTGSIKVVDSEIRGFGVGIDMPERGSNVVRNSTLSNNVNLQLSPPILEGRQTLFENLTFEPLPDAPSANVMMNSHRARYGDEGLLFADDRIEFIDSTGRTERLFFSHQSPDVIPFPDRGPDILRGLTNAEIYRQFELAPGGMLAPDQAHPLAQSNALAADTRRLFSERLTTKDEAQPGEAYPGQRNRYRALDDSNHGGWQVVRSKETGKNSLVYVNPEPPKFMIKRGLLPLEIHPDDVVHGYRIHGSILERVGENLTSRALAREYYDLRVDADGYVRISFVMMSLAGGEYPVTPALKVTADAVRRGNNIDFYEQATFCDDCGSLTVPEDMERFYDTGILEPLPQLKGVCHASGVERIALAPPFASDSGMAYYATVNDLSDQGDIPEKPRRSPYALCEDGHRLEPPHQLHKEIRLRGRGRYSHWGGIVYFSSSDGSDPNTNGRAYSLVRRTLPSKLTDNAPR